MNVGELIKGLEKFPKEMEVVDSSGDTFDMFRYRRIYDSQCPHPEIEHLALCLDNSSNRVKKMDVKELKDIIKCQMYDYPDMYRGDEMIESLFSYEDDSTDVYTEWDYAGENSMEKPIFRLRFWELTIMKKPEELDECHICYWKGDMVLYKFYNVESGGRLKLYNNIPDELEKSSWKPDKDKMYKCWWVSTNPSDNWDPGEDILVYIENVKFK